MFAGQRAETFAIDLGAVFDTINLRRNLPILTLAEDANDNVNSFGFNAFSGFNVNTIALELPISRLTSDRKPVADANKLIGVYAATSRTKKQIHVGEPKEVDFKDDTLINTGDFRQVARLGNPLVNELIIPLGKKDMWNASAPEDEAQFVADYKRLDVAKALQFVSGVPVPTGDRDDIVALLLTYPGQSSKAKLSDLLRLDMSVPPTPPAQIKRLGPLAHDAAGNSTPDPACFPNGRRPNDDVTDIVVRVAGGANFINEPGRRRREPEREGHHPRLPVPAHAVRRPRPAPHGSGRVASVTARRPIRRSGPRRAAIALLGAVISFSAAALRRTFPSDDALVLERLPDARSPEARELRELRARAAAAPRELEPALALARRALELGQSSGDPRLVGQAEAALAPWLAAEEPPTPRARAARHRPAEPPPLHRRARDARARARPRSPQRSGVAHARDDRAGARRAARGALELHPPVGTRRGALHRGLRGSRALARGRAARQLRRARHRAR